MHECEQPLHSADRLASGRRFSPFAGLPSASVETPEASRELGCGAHRTVPPPAYVRAFGSPGRWRPNGVPLDVWGGAALRPPGASIRWQKTGSAIPQTLYVYPRTDSQRSRAAGRAAIRRTRTFAQLARATRRVSMPSSARAAARARTSTPASRGVSATRSGSRGCRAAPSRRRRRGATVRRQQDSNLGTSDRKAATRSICPANASLC
jgi:hypothetical protein